MASRTQVDLSKEYRESLQKEFEYVNKRLDSLLEKINDLHASDIAKLNARMAVVEMKAGIWGLIAGAIPAIGALIYMAINK